MSARTTQVLPKWVPVCHSVPMATGRSALISIGYEGRSSEELVQLLTHLRVTCLLRVSWPHWANDYASPIWLQVGFKKGQPPAAAALSVLRPLAVSGRVFEHTGFADVAIDLPTGTDLDEVMAAVVEQLAEVGRLLAGLPRA